MKILNLGLYFAAALMASVSHNTPRQYRAGTYGTRTSRRGKPGHPGDKLRRLASERRMGVNNP